MQWMLLKLHGYLHGQVQLSSWESIARTRWKLDQWTIIRDFFPSSSWNQVLRQVVTKTTATEVITEPMANLPSLEEIASTWRRSMTLLSNFSNYGTLKPIKKKRILSLVFTRTSPAKLSQPSGHRFHYIVHPVCYLTINGLLWVMLEMVSYNFYSFFIYCLKPSEVLTRIDEQFNINDVTSHLY